MPRSIPVSTRLVTYSIPEPNSGCLLWDGCYTTGGYGKIGIGRKVHAAHRVSYELAFGPFPDGLSVLHRCDVRPCINPDHLFLGNHADNMLDMENKGRKAYFSGEKHGRAKLTAAQVLAILADQRPHIDVAASYAITASIVYRIKTGKLWRHVSKRTYKANGTARGEQVSGSKLTEQKVRAIRADARSQSKIAADYGIAQTLVSQVKSRKIWKHIEDMA